MRLWFMVPGDTTADGEVAVIGSRAFTFQSVDTYSSVTKIPYHISGFASSGPPRFSDPVGLDNIRVVR